MKDVVIIANFVGDLLGNDNNRFIYLAKLMGEHASVELITSDFEHETKHKRKHNKSVGNYKVTLLKELPYLKNVCIKRFISHAVFGKNVANYLENRNKPDVIYCAIPSLDAALAAARYAKKNNVYFIIDIQDLWPEAFKMVFNIPIISNLIFAPMKSLANRIYAQADEIVAVSETYCSRAMEVNKKSKKTHTIFLGTQLSDFDKNVLQDYEINFNREKLKLAYCGTLGSSYDLTCVIDSLDILNRKGIQAPQFIVMGDGPRKKEFEKYAEKKEIDAIFTGRLEYARMCSLLCKCDMVVNPITKGAAQSIINKHADYAACGLPVLNTQECMEYRNLVDEYEMGINCKNNNANDLAEKMQCLIQDESLRILMGKNARRCAKERFDREYSYKEILELIIK